MSETCEYLGLPNCVRLDNGSVEVVVATTIGPRILRYALLGGENIFGEHPEISQQTDLGEWKPWGGHRLWAAPEVLPGSYAPDNNPVPYQVDGLSVTLTQEKNAAGIGKTLTLTLSDHDTFADVLHTITNRTDSPVTLAPWAISVMPGGGTGILPQEPRATHEEAIEPARPLVLWHYTSLTDDRLRLGDRFIRLRTNESKPQPQKIGVGNRQGWAAYYRNEVLFVKRFAYQNGATYPDFGCNNEMYVAGAFFELETLGPLVTLQPGESTEHAERWELHPRFMLDSDDETIYRRLNAMEIT